MSRKTINQIAENGFCSSCGTCAAACPRGRLTLEENALGELVPQCPENGGCSTSCRLCLDICPFSDHHGMDEDRLGKELFGELPEVRHLDALGWFHKTYVGAVNHRERRAQAPSGGLTTALLSELVRLGKVDAVIAPVPTDSRPWFRSAILRSEEEIVRSSGSVYQCVPPVETLHEVLTGEEKRYAIVALPCQAKGLRLLMRKNPVAGRRIRYVVGLTCGTNRSLFYPDFLAALKGFNTGKFLYRSTKHTKGTNQAHFLLDDGRTVHRGNTHGFLWFHHFGLLPACRYCDDIFAELADAAFMEAFLPEYINDNRGTNLVVVRNPEIAAVMERIAERGDAALKTIPPERVAVSQRYHLFGRRSRIPAALRLREKQGKPVLRKRLSLCEKYVVSTDEPAQDARALREAAYYEAIAKLIRKFHPKLRGPKTFTSRLLAWRLFGSFIFRTLRYNVIHGKLLLTAMPPEYNGKDND